MFHLFRSAGRKVDDEEEVFEAVRRNDAAYDDLREALHRLLAERNLPATPTEHRQ